MSEPDCFFWSPLPPSLPDSEEQAARPHKRLTTSSDFVQRFIERNSSRDNDILRCGILTQASVFERLTCKCRRQLTFTLSEDPALQLFPQSVSMVFDGQQ